MNTERPTPRTDEHIKTTNPIHYVRTDFARQLERELAEARERELREALERFRGQFDCHGCTGTAEAILAKHKEAQP